MRAEEKAVFFLVYQLPLMYEGLSEGMRWSRWPDNGFRSPTTVEEAVRAYTESEGWIKAAGQSEWRRMGTWERVLLLRHQRALANFLFLRAAYLIVRHRKVGEVLRKLPGCWGKGA